MAEFAAACRKGGLWPLTAGNRIHVAPPCTIAPQDVARSLEVLDAALSVADAHTAGRPGPRALPPPPDLPGRCATTAVAVRSPKPGPTGFG
ncbi:hypothetical protein ACWEPM_26385 [Streptomyces sp. NPDC004244]